MEVCIEHLCMKKAANVYEFCKYEPLKAIRRLGIHEIKVEN